MGKKSNPYGANQYLLDPRQKLMWDFYINPKSETFSNALQSALKAGYELNYAETITLTEWFLDKVRRLNMVSKAEKVLDKTLDIEDPHVDLRLAQDTAKFIAKTLGKNEGYSERQEHTGADGRDLPVPILANILIKKNVSHNNSNEEDNGLITQD